MFPTAVTIHSYSRRPLALGEEQIACRFMAQAICQEPGAFDPSKGEEGFQQCVQRETVKCEALRDKDVAEAVSSTKHTDWAKYQKETEKRLKKAAIQSAALNVGVSLALMAIPVVGQSLSAIMGVVSAHYGKKYQEKLKAHAKKKQQELTDFVASKQRALNHALDEAYQWAYKKAAPIAVSWQPLEIHEENLQNFMNPLTSSGFGGMGELDGGIVDKITGRDVYAKGRDRINEQVTRTMKEITAEVDPLIAKVRTEGFKVLLAKKIAIQIRQHPQFLAIARQIGIPPPSRFLGMDEPVPPSDAPVIRTQPIPGRSATPIAQSGGGVQQLPVREGSALPTPQNRRIPSTGDRIHWASTETQAIPKETNLIPLVGLGVAAVAATLFLMQ